MTRIIPMISIFAAVVLIVGMGSLAFAQEFSDNNSTIQNKNIVINEIDTNPPGNDYTVISEWVELYNPTDSKIDLGGWEIASTTVLKKTKTIPSGTTIQPGKFLTYSYQSGWFTNVNESVELRNNNGTVIDKTPILSDTKNDFTSWQRIYDGLDTDSKKDWKFVVSTAGSSNGKAPTNNPCGAGTVFDKDSNSCILVKSTKTPTLQEKYDALLKDHKALLAKYQKLISILQQIKNLVK